MPWSQHTISGYIYEIIFDIVGGNVYLISGSFILFFVSVCQYQEAFYQMFQHSLRTLDPRNKSQDMKETLCHLIRFHVTVRR